MGYAALAARDAALGRIALRGEFLKDSIIREQIRLIALAAGVAPSKVKIKING